MSINIIDGITLKTKKHLHNEDYLFHNDNLLILSDGCSSAKNSDIGSRILVLNAANILKNKIINNHNIEGLIELIIQKSIMGVNSMGLDYNVLTASLIIGKINNDILDVYFLGDGCLFVEDKNQQCQVYELKFDSKNREELPFYPLYWNVENLENIYKDNIDKVFINQREVEVKRFYHFSFFLNEIEKIAISTDGVSSFNNLTIHEFWDIFRNIPLKTEGFLQRKLNKFISKKHNDEDKVKENSDDVSMIMLINK